jgi:hypothetical protein
MRVTRGYADDQGETRFADQDYDLQLMRRPAC